MGRKVKCQVTNEYGDSDNFYQAKDRKYYKSKEIYIQSRREALALQKTNEMLDRLLQLNTYPPLLGKIIKDLHKKHSYEVIYLTVKYCSDKIKYAMKSVNFKDEKHKIFYINKIICGEINDVEKLYKRKKTSPERKIIIDEDVLKHQRTNTKKKDISKWL